VAYKLYYRIRFQNVEGQNISVRIADTTVPTRGGIVFPTFRDMTPSGDPFHITTIDNNEDKFTPIRAKQATIQFLADNNFNLNTFATNSGDQRWFCEAFIEDNINPLVSVKYLFQGFLVLNDLSQEFIDNSVHPVVTLTATDGLGLLKDIPLTKPDGTNPRGANRIIDYVSWALQKTGIQASINVMNNLMEESFPGLPAWNNIYLDAKTFEGDEIGTSINCYEVLTKILGEECFLTQMDGQWWIRRIDEYEGNTNYRDAYDFQGVYQNTLSNLTYKKFIGQNTPIQLIAPAALVSLDRPHSFAKETFQFEYPKEIIDNIDFSRDDKNPFYTNTYTDTTDNNLVKTEKRYSLQDWGVWKGTPNNPSNSSVNAYVRRIFVDGYEKERYAVLPQTTSLVPVHWIESVRIPISQYDKFTISVDFSLGKNITGSSQTIQQEVQIMVYGDDGSKWVFGNDPIVGGKYSWARYIEGNINGDLKIRTSYDKKSLDETQWQTVSATVDPIPVTGEIVLRFFQSGFQDQTETRYDNVQFDYIPYINGSYQKYSGQSNKVSQPGDYKANRDKQVSISGSPRKLFKGGFLKQVNGKFVLAGKWYNGAVPSLRGGPPADYMHPYGFIQAYSVWNQCRRTMRLFDCNIMGLATQYNDPPDLMHSFEILDSSPHTQNKKFMLLHYDMDFYRCRWNGFFAEVYDTVLAKKYDDPFEFKFIEGR
jgi:hypothetical protein